LETERELEKVERIGKLRENWKDGEGTGRTKRKN
jgi:hypothetical protein